MSTSEDKPKLIIDEDWKTQVQREKEQLLHKESAGAGHTQPAVTSQSPVEPAPAQPPTSDLAAEDDLPPPPPASFPFIVSMLGTQALAAMGQLGDDQAAPKPRLDYAKHYIDMLAVLEEKTKGNLSKDEYDLLADWLHQLRMTFVSVSKK